MSQLYNPLQPFTPAPDFPTNPYEGQPFYETDTDTVWVYDGSVWVEVGSGVGGAGEIDPVVWMGGF